MKDFYGILGVQPDADDETIKKSYRNLVKEHHPDKGGDENKIKEINEAYDVLSDKVKKGKYDNAIKYGENHIDIENIRREYAEHFGFNVRRQKPAGTIGRTLNVNIGLSLNEILNGVTKKIKYKRKIKCNKCSGKGGDKAKCATCLGEGMVKRMSGNWVEITTCHVCGGVGEVIEKKCGGCNGGFNSKEETIEAFIEPGIENGARMVMSGGGEEGVEVNGDLYLSCFTNLVEGWERNGANVYTLLNLNGLEFIKGGEFMVKNFDENDIKLTVPVNSSPGDLLRLKSKGLPYFRQNNKGDLYVKLNFIKVSDDILKIMTKTN